MAKRDRLPYSVDLRENYFNTFARPAGFKYDSVTAYPLPAKYNIHRMSLFINNTHIGTFFAPFSSTVTWNNLSASEYYTTSTASASGDGIGWDSTPSTDDTGRQTGGNRGGTVSETGTTQGVIASAVPKVYYYDYNGNLRYVAHVQPS